MWRKILNIIWFIYVIATLTACNEKNNIEQRIDGLWEAQLSSLQDYVYWYDSCNFLGQTFFFDMDMHECSLPSVVESLEESSKENYVGQWCVYKNGSQWVMAIKPKQNILRGVYNISFYKDIITNSNGDSEIGYFMRLQNEKWDIKCKKTGILINTW